MSRATTAVTAGAAVALTGALLGSVLVGAWGNEPRTPVRAIGSATTAQLPLRVPAVPVTMTARPRPTPPAAAPKRKSSKAKRPGAAQRDADLAAWLAGSVPPAAATATPGTAGAAPSGPGAPPATGTDSGPTASFVISSFNVLGSSHTRNGARGKASGVARVAGVVQLLARHDVDVVGLQELQSDQVRALQRQTAGAYSIYPGTSLTAREGENSVAWRSSVWELVRPSTVSIPYFDGHRRRMPVVLLKHRATGLQVYVVNVHNPADTRRYHGQQRWRTLATQTEIALVNRLHATGVPVFVTGDMNEREEYFCALTGGTSMLAARGGTNGPGGCNAGRPRAVDWVFGSAGVRFSGYVEDRSPLVDRTTDHPVIAARATVSAG